MKYITFHIVFVITAQIITMLHMLYLRRNHSTILAWFMVILLFPFPAFILYFIFGNRKIRHQSKKNTLIFHEQYESEKTNLNSIKVLDSHAVSSTTDYNDVQLFFDGVNAYRVLINEIMNAQESIYISTYVFKNDSTTKVILEALTLKAEQGLDVKLLIDAVGSYSLYLWQHPLKAFRNSGGIAVFFMPILKDPFKNYINLRNHRKIYLFDGQIVLSGGMNLADEYLGPTTVKKRWIDMIFRIEGEAVSSYREIFAADFFYATGNKILINNITPQCFKKNTIQVIPSGPDMLSDSLYEALLSTIYSAVKRIWIVTPYFVPDETILKALIIAKHKGVDVKLLTPNKSNHWISDLGRSSYMREAEDNGIEIFLYNGNMLHTKAVLFDDYAVMLGSANIDNRSLFLNYEVTSFVYSVSIIAIMDHWVKSLLEYSTLGIKNGSVSRVIMENFMRIFSPQL